MSSPRPQKNWILSQIVAAAVILLSNSAAHAQIYVANSLGGDSVGEYDVSTGAVINATLISGLDVPSGLALSDNRLYVSNSRAQMISVYNATTGAAFNASFITTGLDDPEDIAVVGNKLCVENFSSNSVGLYDATTGAATNTSFISSVAPLAMTIAGNNLFLSSGFADSPIGKYDATTGMAINTSFIAGVTASAFAVSGNVLYVAEQGGISQYDATTGTLINGSFITGLSTPEGLALVDDKLYVSDFTAGTVGEYDSLTGLAINASLITGLTHPIGIVVVPEPSAWVLMFGITILFAYRWWCRMRYSQ